MRVDSLSPKTWLFAGAAGWAVCLWVLSLAGLGGHLGGGDEDVEPQKLPGTTLPRAVRPGVFGQYSEASLRPLFSENRQPQPFIIDGNGEAAQANTFDYTLTSVLIAGGIQLAILKPTAEGAQPVRVKVGEAVETAPQWTLASLEPRAAVFNGPEGQKRLDLRIFNGVGGAEPSPPATVQTAVINETVPGQSASGQPVPPPQTDAVPPPPLPPPAPVASNGNVSTEAQLEAIRKRIEERRAQLRQQAAQEANSPGQPGQTN